MAHIMLQCASWGLLFEKRRPCHIMYQLKSNSFFFSRLTIWGTVFEASSRERNRRTLSGVGRSTFGQARNRQVLAWNQEVILNLIFFRNHYFVAYIYIYFISYRYTGKVISNTDSLVFRESKYILFHYHINFSKKIIEIHS